MSGWIRIMAGRRRHPRWGTRQTYIAVFGAPPGCYRTVSIAALGWGITVEVLRRGVFVPTPRSVAGRYVHWRFPGMEYLNRFDRRMEMSQPCRPEDEA